MRVVVKGNSVQALDWAVTHGIHSAVVVSMVKDETILNVADDDDTARKVVRWYCEPPYQAPFHAGTVLFYSPQSRLTVSGVLR